MKSEETVKSILKLFIGVLVVAYSVFVGMYVHALTPDEITAFSPPVMIMFIFRIGPAGFAAVNSVLLVLFLWGERLFLVSWAKRMAIISLILFVALNTTVLLSFLSLFAGSSF